VHVTDGWQRSPANGLTKQGQTDKATQLYLNTLPDKTLSDQDAPNTFVFNATRLFPIVEPSAANIRER